MDPLGGLDFSYFLKKNDFEKVYQRLSLEEQEIDKELEKVYSEKGSLFRRFADLSVTMNNIHVLQSDVSELECTIKEACDIADTINTKMKKIDIGMSNVTLCQKRVHDLLDLQSCSNGVQDALQVEDYEIAAGHIHRFLAMDYRLLKQAANDMDRDCEVITNSVKLLRDATAMLQNKISLHFKEAINVNDVPKVEQFFKLFPMVGMHSYGLEHYGSFLCSRLRDFKVNRLDPQIQSSSSGKANNTIFCDVLTSLFEEIARIIESNQPLIETYYGSGNLLNIVNILQVECDIHTKSILLTFRKMRRIDQIIQAIDEFSRNSTSVKTEHIDAKDLDVLLDETAFLHSRYQLYYRFVRKKISSDIFASVPDTNEQEKLFQKFEFSFNKSDTSRRMQELIKCQYRVLEKYYMEDNVKKAITTDVVEEGSQVTSLIDNSFFIIRKCIRRAHSTGSIDALCTVLDDACTILETDICATIKKKLKQGYSPGYLDLAQAYNVMLQGRLQPSDPEHSRLLFLAYLNNSEICMDYIQKLYETVQDEIRFSTKTEAEKLESCLHNLKVVTTPKVKAVNEYGLQQLQVTIIKSRVVPWIDSFLTFNHLLTPEEFSSYEADEPFIRKLIMDLDNMLSEFQPRLMPLNYEAFLSIIVSEVTAQMEKIILKTEFSRMGGLALEKEIRTLVNYFTNVTSWSVRDKFVRLIQIATILNLEKVSEISEYWNENNSAYTSNLTPKEIRQFLSLRRDFRSEEINQLKL